ncbi:MAG: CcmD family protein [Candidatus Dadabacteria bacterium]|nr:CcmD family protein [Candidatus Dadabacteria bacterium]
MEYLFWGHTIFWVLIFGYIYSLGVKNKRLLRELKALKESLSGSDDR